MIIFTITVTKKQTWYEPIISVWHHIYVYVCVCVHDTVFDRNMFCVGFVTILYLGQEDIPIWYFVVFLFTVIGTFQSRWWNIALQ